MRIELLNVYKSYFSKDANLEQQVLKGIGFSILPGDAIAIIGPSGSGKSTLLNLLGTLDIPTKGTVSYEDEEVSGFSEKQLAVFRNQKIGFVFQSHHLLPQLNVMENIMLPTLPYGTKKDRTKAEKRALSWLKEVGLEEDIHKFPSQLSGGECQRVAVIRALINQPKLILADEPTGSLDAEAAEKISDLLMKINKEEKVTLVVVTHSADLAKKIGMIWTLANGTLIELDQ